MPGSVDHGLADHDLTSRGLLPSLEVCLPGPKRLGPDGAQASEFDPEAGLDIVEPGTEQAGDMAGIARRRGELEMAQHDLAIDPP